LFGPLANCLVEKQAETENEFLIDGKDITPSTALDVRIKSFMKWFEGLQTVVRRNGDSYKQKTFVILRARIHRPLSSSAVYCLKAR
jgi:hypothetical protein